MRVDDNRPTCSSTRQDVGTWSCDRDNLGGGHAAELARPEGAGPPLPPFTSLKAEAESWAAIATTQEIKTYVAAAVVRLSAQDRANLAAYLERLA